MQRESNPQGLATHVYSKHAAATDLQCIQMWRRRNSNPDASLPLIYSQTAAPMGYSAIMAQADGDYLRRPRRHSGPAGHTTMNPQRETASAVLPEGLEPSLDRSLV